MGAAGVRRRRVPGRRCVPLDRARARRPIASTRSPAGSRARSVPARASSCRRTARRGRSATRSPNSSSRTICPTPTSSRSSRRGTARRCCSFLGRPASTRSIWVLPAVGLVCGIAGLTVVFRRWKREAAATADPTDADRELVAAALADDARRRRQPDQVGADRSECASISTSWPSSRRSADSCCARSPTSNANTTRETSTTRTTPRCATGTPCGPLRCSARSTAAGRTCRRSRRVAGGARS